MEAERNFFVKKSSPPPRKNSLPYKSCRNTAGEQSAAVGGDGHFIGDKFAFAESFGKKVFKNDRGKSRRVTAEDDRKRFIMVNKLIADIKEFRQIVFDFPDLTA